MPTTAEQQYQQDLIRQAFARAQLAQQSNAANAAAQAAMYQADRGLDATKYNADTGLTGTKYTADTGLAGTALTQGAMTDRTKMQEAGANTRAETAIKPQMGELDFQKSAYGDMRADKMATPDYIKQQFLAQELRKALGGNDAAPDPNAPPQPAPTNGGWSPRQAVMEQAGLADPNALQDRQLQQMLKAKLTEAALNGNPQAQAALRAQGFNIPEGTFQNPTAAMDARKATEQTTGTGLAVSLEPDVQDLEKSLSSPNFWVSDKDKAAVADKFQALLLKAKAAGFDDNAIGQFKQALHGRLVRAAQKSGSLGFDTYSDLLPEINKQFR